MPVRIIYFRMKSFRFCPGLNGNDDLYTMLHIPGLYVSDSDTAGRGVFSAQDIDPGDLIEVCPVIVIPGKDTAAIHATVLHDYYFIWPDGEDSIAILLGYGSLYNHADPPNAKVYFDLEHHSVEIRCVRPVRAGEEIYIHYRDGETDPEPLWFEAT